MIDPRSYYYNKLHEHWSKKQIAGEIEEWEMEDHIDEYEDMSR